MNASYITPQRATQMLTCQQTGAHSNGRGVHKQAHLQNGQLRLGCCQQALQLSIPGLCLTQLSGRPADHDPQHGTRCMPRCAYICSFGKSRAQAHYSRQMLLHVAQSSKQASKLYLHPIVCT
jgi:hypothetical protein